MTTRAGVRREYKRHFVLDEGKLRRILAVLRDHGERLPGPVALRLHVQREDDSFYETGDIEEVLDDENVAARAITTLAIELRHEPKDTQEPEHSRTRPHEPVARIAFARFDEERVEFTVEARDRDWCFLLAEELDSQVERTLKASGLFSRFPLQLLDILAGVTVCLAGMALLLLHMASSISAGPTPDEIASMSAEDVGRRTLEMIANRDIGPLWGQLPLLWATMIGVGLVMFLHPISRILEKSSRSVFYWGDMRPLHDAFERRVTSVKWVVGIGFIVSLVATLIGGAMVR